MKVHLFVPCFVDQLYPEAAFNTVKVLERAGCMVKYIIEQTCCGQPAFNAGYWDNSRKVCDKFMRDFADANYIVMPSASCAGFIKNYYSSIYDKSSHQKEIRELQNRVYELSDFLVNVLKVVDLGAKLNCKATYHDSCAALREYKLKGEPRELLAHVKGLELVDLAENETCCGFGGTFSVKYEPISAAMGEQKATNIVNTKADVLISTDLSCLMHIGGVMEQQKLKIKSMHLADVLASGY